MSAADGDFASRYAQTGRFQRGQPHGYRPLPGSRVVFLRSASSRSAVSDVWLFDVDTRSETCLVDARSLASAAQTLPDAERARRERMRQGGGGITGFDVDDAGSVLAFAHAGRLFTVALPTSVPRASTDGQSAPVEVRLLDVPGPVVDPRISPDGRRIAWHANRRLWVSDIDGSRAKAITLQDGSTWGLADFAAAEEFDQVRGHWWAPDSQSLLIARVDDTAVDTRWLGNPALPGVAPVAHKYPTAGKSNTSVSLWLLQPDSAAGVRVAAVGPSEPFEYLTAVRWSGGAALVQLLSRDQRECTVVAISSTGTSTVVAQWRDECWVDVVAGTPRWSSRGELVTVRRDRKVDRMRLFSGEKAISPAPLQIRTVIGSVGDQIIVTSAITPETSEIVSIQSHPGHEDAPIAVIVKEHWYTGVAGHSLIVGTGAGAHDDTWHTEVARLDPPLGPVSIPHYGEASGLDVQPQLHRVGDVRYAILFPSDPALHQQRLPILMHPYGGPHAQEVLIARPNYIEDQWWADQGYAVIIADGRGTPGVSPSCERAVHRDLAGPPLADQIIALDHALATYPDQLDADRVGISGWSFGGFLSALAVLARPDRFTAAVAGAPVTDWELYDTAYTERYLGNPGVDRDPYLASGLLRRADELQRPLLLIHGLADDNVYVAHTLALSSALVAAGRTHSVLPLAGVTHMTTGSGIAAQLLQLEADFFATHLRPNSG